MVAPQDSAESGSVNEALSILDAMEWMDTMKDEMESMRTNHVQDSVYLPPGCNAIWNKWVLKIKRKTDEFVQRYKVRLAPNEREQTTRKLFLPMVRFAAIRTILALVGRMDLEFVQMDIQTASFHGEPDEVIFMDKPKDFVFKGHECKVCRLKWSIYGLK